MMKSWAWLIAACSTSLLFDSVWASDCSTIEVQSGDSCGSLASECGISGSQFTQYNPQPNLCSTLQVGQHVCCTAGTNPYLPTENADGSCATHQVGSGEYCSLIATNYSLTVTELSNFNNQTWGWAGCDELEADFIMCVSTGSPPMPAAVANAECGPQVPGTPKPANMSDLAALNQCPLNACCDKWGQCGTTSDFCTISLSSTGAPGTSAAGTNGCISNCGTQIVSGSAPAEFIKVGYFEAWNAARPCMTMSPADIDTSNYTHIHFAFANVSSGSWDISASQDGAFFAEFVALSGVKRILSFGGWAFSTDPSTYAIFREAMQPSNYQAFANNVVNFVTQNGLDGADFDWEYPGETDIPGIPASSTIDPADYLTFIQYVRNQMPSDLSISIAAPASYWYLKAFPLANIAEQLSYVVFMTYDFHGQWDYQNTYSDPGCPGGSCLRCHVNLTETMNSLSMITKAGVPSSKVVVGVANYARAFGMTDSSCTGPDCTFTGPDSGAAVGNCTQTAGYLSNAEIPSTAQKWIDEDSNCNVATWGNTWAGYMDSSILAARTNIYQNLNMGGTTLWAIDLQSTNEGNANDTHPYCNTCPYLGWEPCTNTYSSIEAVVDDTNAPDYCIDQYLINTLSTIMDAALQNFTQLTTTDNYNSKFNTYASYMQEVAPDNMVDYLNNVTHWESGKYYSCPGSAWAATDQGTGGGQSPSCGDLWVQSDGWPGYPVGEWRYDFTNVTGFWADLEATNGILQEWCTFQNFQRTYPAVAGKNPVPERSVNVTNFPYPNKTFSVPNPSAVVQSSMANLTQIQAFLAAASLASSEVYYISSTDASNDTTPLSTTIQGFIMPVLMLQQSVQSMANIVAIANKISAEEKKEQMIQDILDFLTFGLLLVPFIGEELEAVDVGVISTIGRILPLLGDAGNAAIDLYGAVQDPSSAWDLLFDGLGALKDLADAAKGFRELQETKEIANLGSSIETSVNSITGKMLTCI